MTRPQQILLLLGLAGALGVPNAMIWHKERVIASSSPMLLELAPVDPRSLMQGDYMILTYAISRTLEPDDTWPPTGLLLVTLNENNVVSDAQLMQPGATVDATHLLLKYRLRGGDIRLGAESFFFQEGNASTYDDARYGELRVDDSGEAVLVGLRGENHEILGPSGEHPLQQDK